MPVRFYRFEGFRLDTVRRELRDPAGQVLPLTSRAFDVLCALIAHRDEVVGKDVLLAEAWPGRVVEENNITQAIAALRRAFGTDAADHRFIVTIPGRGYRFVAEIAPTEVAGDASAGVPVGAAAPDRPPGLVTRWRRPLWLGLSGLLLALMLGWGWRAAPGASMPVAMPATGQASAAATPSLVVLPFLADSAVASDGGLLPLGLADALVTGLGHLDGIQILALDSVRRLGASPPAPAAAGRALAADYVLDGRLQSAADGRLQVEARLWGAGGTKRLWSGHYVVARNHLVALRAPIGAAVATALALQTGRIGQRTPAPCEGDDAVAFRLLLRAQYELQQREDGMARAFQDVIRRDPACARAYAGLALAYLSLMHRDSAPEDVLPLARAAALQALRIDPRLADAWVARGRQMQLGEWNWKGAEQALRHALVLNPSLAEAHSALAHLLMATGRSEEGLAQARLARELDPLSPMRNALEGGFLGAAGRQQEALLRLQHALELQPEFWVALQIRGGIALDRGDQGEAVRDLEAAAASSRRTSQVLAMLAFAYVAAGRRDDARHIREELLARTARAYVPPSSLAAVAEALGDHGQALDALEQAERLRDIRLAFLGIDARWNGLRGEPRMQALAARLGLPNTAAVGRY